MILPILCILPALWLCWSYLVSKGYEVESSRVFAAMACLIVWLGFVQLYFTEKDRLESVRESYRMHKAPWQCIEKDEYDYEWVDLTDPICISFREKQNMGVWPNPLRVAADGLIPCVDVFGRAVAVFLSHQTILFQTYIFLFGATVLAVITFAWPWLCWLRSLAPQPRNWTTQRRLLTIEEVEDDTKMLVA